MATHHNFRIKNGLEVGGVLIVNSSGQLVVADITANQKFHDNVRLRFGNSSDFQIHHNSNGNTYIGGGTVVHNSNTWRLMNMADTEAIIKGNADGNVELFYDGGSRLKTTTAGVQIPSTGTTIGWSNLANAWLLLGTSSAGIGIDNNEIMAKGVGSLYLGTGDSGANVIIRAGGTSARMTIAASDGEVTIPGDLSVGGDLNITGDINSVSVTDLDVVDKTITLGKGQTEGNSGGSGIIIDGSGAQMLWDETDNRFEFNKNLHSTGNIISAAGTSQFYGAQVNAGGLRVQGGGTYSDPGSQMYLYADASGHGYLAVHDLFFYVGGNNSRTVQALKLTSTGDVHLKDNAVLQFGNSSHSIQSGASHGGGDMTLTSSDDMWFRTRWARFQDIVGSAGEYARISYNGSWIYSTLTSRHIKPQADSSYNLGEVNNRYATVFGDTGRFADLDIDNNVDIDGTLETDGLTVNNNPVYIRDEKGASVAGAGYYRVAANTASGAGRGAFICTVYTTGGSYAPKEVVIQGHADWSSTETIHTVKSSAGNTYFTKARIVRESGDAFLEVYFYGAITDLEIETVAVGQAGWYSLSGTLTAATGTESRTGPETLIAPGLNTQEVINSTQGFQVNNQTVIDNSRNIENITTITTEGTATSGTIMDIRPSDTNQMFRVRFPDSSTMEMGTTRTGNGNVQKAVVYGQAGVDITTNGVLRASMTQAGDLSLDADCGGLYFGGSTRSTTTNAQAYIKESGLNLDIKGNDNVRLLGDGGSVILHADYTGKVMIGSGATAPASILHVKGTQSYGSIRVSPTSANGESAMAFFLDTAGTQTSNAWVVGHAGWGNTNDFVIGNQAFGGPVMLMQQDGKVGIGTLTPSSVLDVRASLGANGTAATPTAYFVNKQSGATSGSIYIGASSGIDWKIGKNVTGISGNVNFSIADSSGNRRFDIDGSGNVGIGTSSPNDGKLQISANSSSDWGTYIYNTNASGLGLHVETNSYGTEQLLRLSSLTGSGGSNTVRMVVRADGNVGIGTASPNAKLQVAYNGGHTSGNISISQSNLDLYNPLEANTDEKGAILTFSDHYQDSNGYPRTVRAAIKGGTDTVGNTADGFLAFYTDSGGANSATERMRINSAGNVGIGTTNPNTYTNQTALTINGTTHARVDLEVGGVIKGNIHVDSGSINVDAGANKVRFNAGNTERARISSTGRLHVNHTNDPGWDSLGTLVVRQISDDIGIGIVDDASQNTFKLLNNGTFAELSYNVDLPMIFTTGTGAGTERMRINAGGNVSIGSFGTPDAKLHVDGAAIIGGNENKATTPIAGLHIIDDTYSQWSGTLAPEQCALRVETYYRGNNAHDRAAGDYGGGIVFNHLGGHSTTHDHNMHCWVGPRVWDTPGRERAALVFATNDDTSTSPAAGVTTIEERMCITPYGKVGIGTKTPDAPLSVLGATGLGTGASGIRVHRPDSFGQFGYLDYGQSSGTTYVGSSYTGSNSSTYGVIRFRQHSNGGADKDTLTIAANNNVGIGSTNPLSKLDVVGNSGDWSTRIISSTSNGVNYGLSVDTSAGQAGTWGAFNVYAPGSKSLLFDNNGALTLNGTMTIPTGTLNVGGVSNHAVLSITTRSYERFFNSSYGPHGTANLMYKLNLGNSGGLSGVLEITVQGTYSHQDVSGYVKRTTNIGLNPNGSIWRNTLQSIEHFGQAPGGIVIGPVQWDSSASQYYVNIYKITSAGNAFTVGVKLTTASGTDGGFSTWTLSNHATLAAPTGYTSRYDTNARPQSINRQYITDTSSEAFRVAGNVNAAEFDLPSGGMLDWANGDARIIEGNGENYSLSLQTYDGSTCNTNTRFDGDNSVHHFGNEFSFLNNKIDMHYDSTPNGLSNVPTMRIGDYGRSVEELQFNVSQNGTARICFKDNNWSEGCYIKSNGETYGGKIYFGSMWNTETDRIVMDLTTSRMGINNTNPQSTLDVSGDIRLTGSIIGNSSNTTEIGTYSTGAIKRIRMSQGGELHFGDTTTANFLGITEGAVNNFSDQDRIGIYFRNEMKFYSNSNTLRHTFDVNGNYTAVGNITAYSDIRLKDDLQPIEDAVSKVQKLKGVTYIRNDNDDENRQAGLIAQDVELVLPEAVRETEDGTKTVNYNATIALLVESIKEQQTLINRLEKRINTLENNGE